MRKTEWYLQPARQWPLLCRMHHARDAQAFSGDIVDQYSIRVHHQLACSHYSSRAVSRKLSRDRLSPALRLDFDRFGRDQVARSNAITTDRL
jgi:hypothetical protein